MTLLAKGQKSGFSGRVSPPNTATLGHKQQLGEKAVVTYPDKIVHPGGTCEALRGRGYSIILPPEDPASHFRN